MAKLAIVREALEYQAAQMTHAPAKGPIVASSAQSPQVLASLTKNLSAPTALDQLCSTFGLSGFERDLLLLCVGMELDASFPALCANAQADPQRTYPTFSLALAALADPHWSALTPKAPLRRWRLLEIGAGKALSLSPLRVDERILHYLTGIQHLDERLIGLVKPLHPTGELVPSHRRLAERLAATWSSSSATPLPVVQLCGEETAGKRAIAIAACTQLGLNLHLIPAHAIPTSSQDLNDLLRLWEREAILSSSALLLDYDEGDGIDAMRENAIAHVIETMNSPLVMTSRDRRRSRQRPLVTLDVSSPTPEEQRLLWQTALGAAATELNGQVDEIVAQFNLSTHLIQAACTEVQGRMQQQSAVQGNQSLATLPSPGNLAATLWETCRVQVRPRLDELAQRIESSSTWDDLVLPEAQRQVLRDIAAHVRQRTQVYENWGFAGKGGRGLGISALFAGASGTGKTMAADVLAQTLQLDLYRIDLSAVVSKYIGETEKNLRRVFDAAEVGGVILLFDEADALFGKRSEVKDSHDRYANMEVSYLLQRMEAYRGLAILTTNLKDAIDVAFLRRIRFVVKFPFPDTTQRAEIWRRVFPANTPVAALDVNKLARLNVAGGNIRNIALNAAFLAADAREVVQMKHLLTAAKSEYAKLERTLTDAEVKGWI